MPDSLLAQQRLQGTPPVFTLGATGVGLESTLARFAAAAAVRRTTEQGSAESAAVQRSTISSLLSDSCLYEVPPMRTHLLASSVGAASRVSGALTVVRTDPLPSPAVNTNRLFGALSQQTPKQQLTGQAEQKVLAPDDQERTGLAGLPAILPAIRALIEREQIGAARRLLETAIAAGSESVDLVRLRDTLAPPRAVASRIASEIDRSRDYDWLRANRGRYLGRWVAVAQGRLVAEAGSLKDLLAQVKALELPETPLVHRYQ